MALTRYAAALRAPGVPRLLISSLVARMPFGMASLSILLLVTREHGYGEAGVVSGLYVAASGLSNLALSRAADRYGPRPVLVPTAIGYAGAMTALALVPADALAAQIGAAVAAGAASPPVVAVIRGAWSRLYEADVAQAIYGLEAPRRSSSSSSVRRRSRLSPQRPAQRLRRSSPALSGAWARS
jgi:MFS family permease